MRLFELQDISGFGAIQALNGVNLKIDGRGARSDGRHRWKSTMIKIMAGNSPSGGEIWLGREGRVP
jgi:ABC-type sugar transport system ATPase subunit